MVSVQDCLVSTQRLGRFLGAGPAPAPEPLEAAAAAVQLVEVRCRWPGNDFEVVVPHWSLGRMMAERYERCVNDKSI